MKSLTEISLTTCLHESELMDFLTCKLCILSEKRTNVVIGKGTIPCDILFLGEGPGRSEDTTGVPFYGPSGRLLDKMLRDSWNLFLTTYKGDKLCKLKVPVRSPGGTWFTKEFIQMPTTYITNTVLCRPSTEEDENRKPASFEVLACMANVKYIISRAAPRIVVFVGKEAEKYYKDEFPEGVRITHPAALLRSGGLVSRFYNPNIRILQSIYERLYHVH